jgi:UDP-N-acetylglucosamine--N-acetylmuramyl-(pentapeptide) pyrophosphoryl-undecaprenol N-acetylglucosamine transferase
VDRVLEYSSMRIVLTGGGTGGHLTPLIAVAKKLRQLESDRLLSVPPSRDGDLDILFVGLVTDIDRRFLEEADIPAFHIPSGKIRRYLSGAGPTFVDLVWRLPLGILRALWRMYILMPEVVFSKGGYGSVPVGIASWVYRIPVLLHETDVIPGLANRRLARFSTAIGVGFRAAEKYFKKEKAFVSGTPLRAEFTRPPAPAAARKTLGLHDRKPVIFVTGGSQGAQRINTVIIELLVRLLPEFQFVHQVGAVNLAPIQGLMRETFRNFPDIADYHLLGFLDPRQMVAAYAAADLVVCRAGGTTLAEVSAAGRPSLLIPLHEAANNHQWENAYLYREAGAAVVVDETNLSAPLIEATIRKLFQRPQQLQLMASRARDLGRPSATEDIAETIVAMGSGYAPRRKSSPVMPAAAS